MSQYKRLIICQSLLLGSSGTLAYGAEGPMISMNNTDFVVSLAFLAFISLIVYLKVPKKIGNILDKRSDTIKLEIESANKILEESKTLLAELEREHKLNIQKAEKIIQDADNESKRLIKQAKEDLKLAIGRKISLAEDQIKAVEKSVIKSVRDKAIDMSIVLAKENLKASSSKNTEKANIDSSIEALKNSIN